MASWLLLALPCRAAPHEIRFEVVDAQERPLEGAWIRLRAADASAPLLELTTDKDGRARGELAEPPATLSWEVSAQGHLQLSRSVRVSGVASQYRVPLQAAADADWSGADAAEARQLWERGQAASRAEDWPAAEQALARLVELRPRMAAAWLELGAARFSRGEYRAAVEAAVEARSLGCEQLRARKLIADARSLLGRGHAPAAAAKPTTEQPAAAVTETAQEALTRALEAVEQGDDEGALPLLRRAVELDPELAAGHYELGLALLRMKDRDGARRHLDRFIELSPASPLVPSALALLDGLG